MDSSILVDVRAMTDVGQYTNSFDDKLIPLINTYLFRSAQAGVGQKGFMVKDTKATWRDFIGENAEQYAAIKDYIGIRVKLIFDPPESAALLAALKEEAKELEWCLYDEALIQD